MKRLIQIGVLLIALCVSAQESQQARAPCIPDAKTALKIAEQRLAVIYGNRKIDAEKPLSAVLDGGVWTVSGTLWCSDGKGGRTRDCDIGGVAQIRLRQRDGKVLSITHGK